MVRTVPLALTVCDDVVLTEESKDQEQEQGRSPKTMAAPSDQVFLREDRVSRSPVERVECLGQRTGRYKSVALSCLAHPRFDFIFFKKVIQAFDSLFSLL